MGKWMTPCPVISLAGNDGATPLGGGVHRSGCLVCANRAVPASNSRAADFMGDSFFGLSYRNALEGADNAGWKVIASDFVHPAPGHVRRFAGAGDLARFSGQGEDQIV